MCLGYAPDGEARNVLRVIDNLMPELTDLEGNQKGLEAHNGFPGCPETRVKLDIFARLMSPKPGCGHSVASPLTMLPSLSVPPTSAWLLPLDRCVRFCLGSA